MDRMASRFARGGLAVGPSPSIDAHLTSLFVAHEMSEIVISRPTKLGARRVEIVQVTLDSNPVRDPSSFAEMVQCMPFGGR